MAEMRPHASNAMSVAVEAKTILAEYIPDRSSNAANHPPRTIAAKTRRRAVLLTASHLVMEVAHDCIYVSTLPRMISAASP